MIFDLILIPSQLLFYYKAHIVNPASNSETYLPMAANANDGDHERKLRHLLGQYQPSSKPS